MRLTVMHGGHSVIVDADDWTLADLTKRYGEELVDRHIEQLTARAVEQMYMFGKQVHRIIIANTPASAVTAH